MTKKRQKLVCYRQLEQLHKHLTRAGKDHLRHQVLDLELNELEVEYNNIYDKGNVKGFMCKARIMAEAKGD